MSTTAFLLSAFIMNLGIALGAGLYETRIVLPLWFPSDPSGSYAVDFAAMRNIDSGKKFWAFVTTMPLTLLTIANLVFALRSNAPLHDWWVAGTSIVVLERLSTFTFFIPTAIKLQKGENIPLAKLSTLVLWWTRMNQLRNLLTFCAMILLLMAVMVR